MIAQVTTFTENRGFEHCQRVSHACGLAVRHASLLLGAPMQEFVSGIIDLGPSRIDHCLREINKRQGGSAPERRLLEALRVLVARVWKGDLWLCRRHFEEVLSGCTYGVADLIDRANNEGFDGPAQTAEMNYQRDFILPIIEESFKTLWAAEKEERKLEKVKAQERKASKSL
jgi:hypothetical protein